MHTTWFTKRGGDRGAQGARLAATLNFTGALAGGNTHRMRRDGREVINFSTNDYLSLGELAAVRRAGAAAVLEYGASTGASRLLAGEYGLHLELERALAAFLRTEAALTFVSGHATNVTVIGTLFGPRDVVIHDQFAHNSMLEGIRLAGARRVAFRHNDLEDLEHRLQAVPADAERVLVCVDGVYSMHGDLAPLPQLVELRRRYGFLLYVDDAHAVGTLGRRGAGSADAAGVDPSEIDVLMGTLGKAIGSCGGFIAGTAALIEHLRWTVPGFVFSAGVPAPQTAVALAAIRCLDANPEWVDQLRRRSRSFRRALSGVMDEERIDDPTPIVPVPVPPDRVLAVATRLNDAGIRVFPILPPAVSAAATRLRFSVSRSHGLDELLAAARTVRDVVAASVA